LAGVVTSLDTGLAGAPGAAACGAKPESVEHDAGR